MIDSVSSHGPAGPGTVEPDPLALDDPHGALRHALVSDHDPAASPEDIVLGWLLRLPERIDPAGAAARVIAGRGAVPVRNDRLLALLSEIAHWPVERLAPFRGQRRAGPH